MRWGLAEAFGLAPKSRTPDHLKISAVNIGPEPRAPMHFATGRAAPLPQVPAHAPALQRGRALQEKYETSLKRIEGGIYTIAAAVTALDAIESRLAEARGNIEDLIRRNQPIDYSKVERLLTRLAEHTNVAVASVDDQCVNLLRDSKIEIKLTEIDGNTPREVAIDLTLISLKTLIDHKLSQGPGHPRDIIAMVDHVARVVSANVHILSSMMLSLIASRNYVDEVTELVLPGRVRHELAVERERREAAARRPMYASERVEQAGDERYHVGLIEALSRAGVPAVAEDDRPSLVDLLNKVRPREIA